MKRDWCIPTVRWSVRLGPLKMKCIIYSIHGKTPSPFIKYTISYSILIAQSSSFYLQYSWKNSMAIYVLWFILLKFCSVFSWKWSASLMLYGLKFKFYFRCSGVRVVSSTKYCIISLDLKHKHSCALIRNSSVQQDIKYKIHHILFHDYQLGMLDWLVRFNRFTPSHSCMLNYNPLYVYDDPDVLELWVHWGT